MCVLIVEFKPLKLFKSEKQIHVKSNCIYISIYVYALVISVLVLDVPWLKP